jgi:hypothetical protein
MRNLQNPKWLFLINTLPIAVLFFLFISQFNIIKSLLEPESVVLWKTFGITLGGIALINFLYSTYLTISKKIVSIYYGLISLLVYIPFIYLYGYHSEEIIPFSIPRWMIPGDMILYVGTFLMPTLAYSLFILVSHFTPKTKEHKPWKSFLFAIAVPLVWYIFSQAILPLWKPIEREFQTHVTIIFVIAGTLLFLFFLIRGIYILATKKATVWKRYQLVWKIPISIIFPILGLLVNNGFLFNEFDDGIFGCFNNHWFYIIAALNGLVICLPNRDLFIYRFLLFIGRSTTFAFTFYFFIVFLPFLPISIIAVVAIGTGFLMLTPLILFVLHINELSKDLKYLKKVISNRVVNLVSVAGFLVLPLLITLTFIGDKNTLEEILDYLYTPDYSKTYDINKESLKKTLNVLKQHKDRNGAILFGSQIPYISSYFNWLVLDNITLSDAKINNIEKVFFGKSSFDLRSENIRNENVEITNSTVESVFDENQKAWRSWINLEITNKSGNSWAVEYATTIELPVGCWISDYYLYVRDRKEMGILAEKKSAMWVFSQIRNENRDPGILYYLTGNKVAFRIFPFAKDEVRRTGIEFLHKEPVNISIDGIDFQLGERGIQEAGIIENSELVYIPASKKSSLEKTQRQPYFHFLLDVSEANKSKKEEFIGRVNKLMAEYPDLSKSSKISKVNSYVSTLEITEGWESYINQEDFNGGFYLDRAIKSTLVNSHNNNDKTYPIIIVVTDSIYKAILNKDFSDLAITFPENKLFYLLTEQGQLEPHSLIINPKNPLADSLGLNFHMPCLEYKTVNQEILYISTDTVSCIALKSEFISIDEKKVNEKDWTSALQMHGNWISQNLNPSKSETDWKNLVKSSFVSRIMTPVTSYLVVENEAQKAILKKKQEQVLSSNKSLDVGEDAEQMTEPGLIVLAVLLGLIIWIREKRKMNKKSTAGNTLYR